MSAQITLHERYAISAWRQCGLSVRAIAGRLSRSPSSISRELARNHANHDGFYRPDKADSYCAARRRRSRRTTRFSTEEWDLVEYLVRLDWSPEQVAGRLVLHGVMRISHETSYLHVWHDKRCGGDLWTHLRQATKKRRKRYGLCAGPLGAEEANCES